MHFSTIFTTAMALPLLSMAAPLAASENPAADLVARQSGTQTCDQFQFVATGAFSITNNFSTDLEAWTFDDAAPRRYSNIIPNIPAGQTRTVSITTNDGMRPIKFCDVNSNGEKCFYPAGFGSAGNTRDFSILPPGNDRWNVNIVVNKSERNWISYSCTIGSKLAN